jgi:hypothetical protein
MTRLAIEVDVPAEECNPALVDPHDIAEALVDGYEADLRHGQSGPHVSFVSARWAP